MINFSPENTGDSLQPLQALIAGGDEAAFRQLFNLLFGKLTRFAHSLVKSDEVAADIVDGVFVRVWSNRISIVSIGNLRVYLYRAVKNEALNYLSRKAHLHIYEPFDDINIQLKDEMSPERLMITQELLNKIRAAVDALPPRCKMIFKLVREDGLRYREVADILNLSAKTVDAQMVIAIGRIREAMKEDLHLAAPGNVKKNIREA
ncbi:MAG: RNA polymerase sigma-70 factor [Sphingobacteriales bacterium]|nr:RNA polymerase sigma-70 factor [Sphingobacteriales bacterium]